MLAIGAVTGRDIAAKYGLSPMAVSRHKTRCIKSLVKSAAARKDAAAGDRLLGFGQKCIQIAEDSLGELVANKDHRTIPGMISAGMKAVETVARLECRPGFGDAVAPATVVQIAMVRMPAMCDAARVSVDTIDAKPAALVGAAGVNDAERVVDAELVD